MSKVKHVKDLKIKTFVQWLKRLNIKRRLGIILGIVIFLIGVSIIAIMLLDMHANNKDRENFLDLKHKVSELAEFFEDKTDQHWDGGAACSRPHIKYDTSSEARCIVHFQSLNESKHSGNALKRMAEQYENLMSEFEDVSDVENEERYQSNTYRTLNFRLDGHEKIKCYMRHEIIRNKGIESAIDCSGTARDAWFEN